MSSELAPDLTQARIGSLRELFPGCVTEATHHKPLRAVFRDAGFADSAAKINVEQIFNLLSPATEVKTI